MRITKNLKKFMIIVFVFSLISSSTIVMLTGCNAEELGQNVDNSSVESKSTNEIEDQATGIDNTSKTKEVAVVNTEAANETESQSQVDNQTKEEAISDTETIVRNIIGIQEIAISEKNRNGYMSTINPKDELLKNDSNMWSYLLSQGDMKNFSLKLNEILAEEEEKVVAMVI